MDEEDRPRRKGDLASQLAGEVLDTYSRAELDARIALLKQEIERVTAHRERASVHRAAAEALFRSSPPDGTPR